MGILRRSASLVVRYVYSMLAGAWFSIRGIFSQEHRRKLVQSSEVLGFRRRHSIRSNDLMLPSIHLKELVLTNDPIQVLEPEAADGNVSLYELLALNSLIRTYKPSCILEIGTFDGRTTLNMSANAPSDSTIYTLDLPQEEIDRTALPVAQGDQKYILKASSGERFVGRPESAKIKQLYGDSASFNFDAFRGKMDFVFVDGGHSPEYVKNDSMVALSVLSKNGGVILWHDYKPKGHATGAINRLTKEVPEFKNIARIEGTSLAFVSISPREVHS